MVLFIYEDERAFNGCVLKPDVHLGVSAVYDGTVMFQAALTFHEGPVYRSDLKCIEGLYIVKLCLSLCSIMSLLFSCFIQKCLEGSLFLL